MSELNTQKPFIPKEVFKLLSFIQEHPSEESNDLTAIVLKMGLNSVAQKKAKNAQQENILKFTKKEIDSMSEPVKILLIYSGYEIKYRTIKNTFQVRFRETVTILSFAVKT